MFRRRDTDSSIPREIEDCLECRVVGVASLGGISAYAANLRVKTPVSDPKQRLFLAIFSAAFGAAAIARGVL